jgi:thymidylate synthase (FAD)
VKTEIVMTANLREWRHFFKLRALGTTGKPHPQMLELTIPLLKKFAEINPIIFGDLAEKVEFNQ